MRALLQWTAILVLLVSGTPGCRKEQPAEIRGEGPAYRSASAAKGMGSPLTREPGVRPGLYPSVVLGTLSNPYANDPAAAVEGRKLFVWYNCSGCHGGRAGGGMGPSLRDSLWLYGSDDTHVFSTILEGRAAGMPAWGAKLPERQIWLLVSYIRTLGRSDEPERVEPRERRGFKTPGGLEPATAASAIPAPVIETSAPRVPTATLESSLDTLPGSAIAPRAGTEVPHSDVRSPSRGDTVAQATSATPAPAEGLPDSARTSRP